jgi:hypothetical protein
MGTNTKQLMRYQKAANESVAIDIKCIIAKIEEGQSNHLLLRGHPLCGWDKIGFESHR